MICVLNFVFPFFQRLKREINTRFIFSLSKQLKSVVLKGINMKTVMLTIFLSMFAGVLLAVEPVIQWKGVDLKGGAKDVYGSSFFGRTDVNFVYSQKNDDFSQLSAHFAIDKSSEPLYLYLDAIDDDADAICKIEIKMNDHLIFSGKNEFGSIWTVKRYEIPQNILLEKGNEFVIKNIENEGEVGFPPWFMISRAAIATDSFQFGPVETIPKYEVVIPEEVREFPEPLTEGEQPGFAIRGTKGWNWTPEQYLAEISVLAEYKMNFLMNCYLSLYSVDENGRYSNQWWRPLSEETKEKFIEIFKKARQYNIEFCFGVHPQLGSQRPLDPNSQKDIEDYYQHFEWAQKQGVRWFSVSLDDVSWGNNGPSAGASGHAKLANYVLEKLRDNDPEAQLIFCPTPYWGDGTSEDHRAYLETLAQELHQDVYVFWTGDAVVPEFMTYECAAVYKSIVKHRMIIWENYPVNDSAPTLHLGPIVNRDPELAEIADGYMSNPLCPQNEINRIPLLTCADFSWNPKAYDPDRSIGQAIVHLAKTDSQKAVLKELVEAYPGMIICKIISTGFNPVLFRFNEKMSYDRQKAIEYVTEMEMLEQKLENAFPDSFNDAKETLRGDITKMKMSLEESENQ